MAYSDISSAETDPESPLTTSLMVKYVDNLLQVEEWVNDRMDGQVVSNWHTMTGPATLHNGIWYDNVNDVWVAVCDAGVIEWSDDDGISWTAAGMNPWGGAENLTSVFHDGSGLWVCGGPDSGNRGVASSVDGDTWDIRDANTGGDGVNAVTHDLSGMWVVVAQNGKISTSPDGINWTTRASGVGSNLYAVCYGDGLFVAAGAAGVILTSDDDGVTWVPRVSGFGASTIWGVRYGDGKFVAVGAAAKFSTSLDGITWNIGDSGIGAGNDLMAVEYNGGRWVTVSDNGLVLTSPVGTSWTERYDPGAIANFWCVARNGASHWLAGGNGAPLLSSQFDPSRVRIP